MSLIRKASELQVNSTIKMMVYGSAGIGKTTLALSSPKPLLLDFDGGVKRVNLSHLDGVDTVQVENWGEIHQLLDMDLNAYETIVVDTIGKMMDFIIDYKCGKRQPRIQDWGAINQEFQWFTRAISSLGKHVVFIAHRDTRKEDDKIIYIPSLREKNYNAIVTELDLLGYAEAKTIQGQVTRTITFETTDRNDGKNTCNLPTLMTIPAIVDAKGNATAPNDFIQEQIIASYERMLNEKKELQRRYNDVVAALTADIAGIANADDANAFVSKINDYEHIGTSKQKASVMLKAKAEELNLTFDKKTKKYVTATAKD